MLIHIANYFDADRRSAVAGEDLPLGAVCKVASINNGKDRSLTKVTVTGDLVPGGYAVAFKVSVDPLQVTSSTVNADSKIDTGNRVVSIKSGDAIVECRVGSIIEYDPSLLHASLDPARAGALPAAGAALGILGGLWCTAGTATAIVAPVVGRVFNVVNGKIRVELVGQ